MKKLLLSLGAIASVAAPVAAVVACGSTDGNENKFVAATDAQANALSSLTEAIATGNIGGESVFDIDSSSTVDAEIEGSTIRLTFTPAADADGDVVRVTLSLQDKKVTKVERKLNGEFHDNTSAATNLAMFNQSNAQEFTDAATALAAIDAASAATQTVAADFDLGVLKSEDLIKNIFKTPSVIDGIAKTFAAKILADGVKTVSFKLDAGDSITFDFGSDHFLHDGNAASVAGEVLDGGGDTTATFGNDDEYIGTTNTAFVLTNDKLDAKDTNVLATDANFVKQTKYLIRMIVAAKTGLHYVGTHGWAL